MFKNIINSLLFIAFFLNLLTACWLLIKSRKKTIPLLVAAFSTASAFWALGIGLFRSLPDHALWVLYSNQLLICSGALIASPFLHFSILFSRKMVKKRALVLIYAPTLVFIILAFIPNALIKGTQTQEWGRASLLGSAYPLFTAYFVLYYCIGFFLLGIAFLRAQGKVKNQLSYILLATFSTCTIDLFFNVILVEIVNYKYVWVGPLSAFVWVSVLAYAITKHELMDIRVAVSKTTAYIATFTLYGLCLSIVLLGVSTILEPRSLGLLFLTCLGCIFLTSLTFHKVRDHLQTVSDKFLFKQQVESEAVAKTTAALNYEINAALSTLHLASQKLEKSQTLGISDKTVVQLIGNCVAKIGDAIEKIQKG